MATNGRKHAANDLNKKETTGALIYYRIMLYLSTSSSSRQDGPKDGVLNHFQL